jgi:uncharacterized repeat protein (TIGR01451 family)
MCLGPASGAAVNAALDANCPATDQRGVSRPQGTHCDSGAFELEAQYLPKGADLAIVKQGRRARAEITYLLIIQNHGPERATSVKVIDRLDEDLTFVSVATSRGTCAYKPQPRKVKCQLGKLSSGAAVTIELVVDYRRPSGVVSNAARVKTATSDPNPANNTAVVEVELD